MDLHNINPRDVQPAIGEPINKLFWAVNHYVSTGDHIGEGVAYRQGSMWLLTIPVSTVNQQDQQDMAALRSRLERITTPTVKLGYLGEMGNMEGWQLTVADADIPALIEALTKEPGPLGWGSGKTVIDKHQWRHG